MNRIKKYQVPAGPLTVQQWGSKWQERLQPSSKSKVLLKPWKALNNIDYQVIPDTTFTRDKTGAGSIEYFNAAYPQGITYPNGYHKSHPMPGKDVLLYNPKDNDEQDIRLDALHIMPKDATYDVLNTLYRNAAKDGDVAYNAQQRYNEDVKKYGKENLDTYEQYFNNEADGLLRNMLIEGTPEYIASKRYYPNKTKLRQWNSHLLPYIDSIQKYLETGKRPADILPEVVVTGKKKQGGKMNILEFLKNGSGIHIKKENRGKFTSYCGGKVTDECIRKGKNSSNPAIRKRATFADNARHFKHRLGGSIVEAFKLRRQILSSLNNTINN